MLWFYIRCRGQPPRFFLRDDYHGLSDSEKNQLEIAYEKVILELLGEVRTGSLMKREPAGLTTSTIPFWKGFVFPQELKSKLMDGLTKTLHPESGIPSGLKIVGYSNLP